MTYIGLPCIYIPRSVHIYIPHAVCMPKRQRERCCCCPKPTTTKSCTTEKRNQHPTTPTVCSHTHTPTHTWNYTHERAEGEGAAYFQLPLFEFGIFQNRLPRLTFQSAALVVVLLVVGGGVSVRVYMLHARAVNRYKRQKKWQLCPVYFSLHLLYSYIYAYIISN